MKNRLIIIFLLILGAKCLQAESKTKAAVLYRNGQSYCRAGHIPRYTKCLPGEVCNSPESLSCVPDGYGYSNSDISYF